MTSEGLRIKYLDASALVKLYIDENGSQHLRDLFYSSTNFTTTWLCLAEAIGLLKRKLNREKIKSDKYKYLKAVISLIIEWRDRIESDDINSVDPTVPLRVREIAEKYNLDYSDALQLWSIKYGKWSPLLVVSENNVTDSALFLITADGPLASAAESEGINVWNCTAGPAPFV